MSAKVEPISWKTRPRSRTMTREDTHTHTRHTHASRPSAASPRDERAADQQGVERAAEPEEEIDGKAVTSHGTKAVTAEHVSRARRAANGATHATKAPEQPLSAPQRPKAAHRHRRRPWRSR